MKSEELRLGNYVFEQGEFVNITQIDESIVSYHGYEPIPLTEEILLKCGFEKQSAVYSLGADLVIGIDLDFVGIYNDRNEDDIELDCPKYLHQLQNLYFALTGKELNIKL